LYLSAKVIILGDIESNHFFIHNCLSYEGNITEEKRKNKKQKVKDASFRVPFSAVN
jgi:hypothetical protein